MGATTRRRLLLGATSWLALVAAASAAYRFLPREKLAKADHVRVEMWRALLETPPTYTVHFTRGVDLARGDGVMATVGGRLERVGEVVRVRQEVIGGPVVATFALDDRKRGLEEFRPSEGTHVVRRTQGGSFLFALQTLLPKARFEKLRSEWERFRAIHAESLARELTPLATDLLRGALDAIVAELPTVLARHEKEIDLVLGRLQGELAGKPLGALLASEVWPILERHGAEPAERIGRELWERVPLMSFAMRALSDRVLEDGPVRVEERWRRFVDEEALPLLRAERPAIEAALWAMARDAATDPQLREGLREIFQQVRDDPAVQALARRLARELLAENPRLEQYLRELPSDPALRARLLRVSDELQEFLTPLGDLLFLDQTGQGINPDLAYLIRLLLLRRDAQLLHLEGGTGAPLPPGGELPGSDGG